MDESIVIQILRDLQARFAEFDTRLKKVETEMAAQTGLLSKLDTQMRGGFEATMFLLGIHSHGNIESRVKRIEQHLNLE